MNHRHSLRALSLVSFAGLLISGCAAAPEADDSEGAEEPGVAASPIEGADHYGADCSPGMVTFLDKIMLYGRASSNSRAFAQCMSNVMTSPVTLGGATFGPYRKCNGDPFYGSSSATQLADVMAATHSTADITINCTGGSGNASTSLGTYGVTPETLNFSGWLGAVYNQLSWPVCNGSNGPNCRAAAAPWPYSQAAGIIWHEQSHTQGYTHGANDQAGAAPACGYSGDPTWNFQYNTMPYVIQDCLTGVIDQSGITCGALDTCGPGRVKMIDGLGSSSCTCVPDPRGCLAANPRVATVVATASNTAVDYMDIDNPYSNNNPNAVVTATAVWWSPVAGSTGVYNNHPIGVFYDSSAHKWAVFNEDYASMPIGAAFNIEVDTGNVVTATAATVSGNTMLINDPALNNNPDATVMVTPNWNPGGAGGMYDTSPIGVYYAAPYWRIFNQNGTTMQVGESFNVHVDACAQAITANAGNSVADYVQISSPLANGNPYAQVFVTPNWNPDGRSGVYETHPIGVYYEPTLARWTVFHQDGTAIPAGESYNVLVRTH